MGSWHTMLLPVAHTAYGWFDICGKSSNSGLKINGSWSFVNNTEIREILIGINGFQLTDMNTNYLETRCESELLNLL